MLVAGTVDEAVEDVLTLLSGLLLAKGPFGVPGRLLLNEAGKLDRLGSYRGAGDAVPDPLAGLSKGLGAAPDLLVGRSKMLLLVGAGDSVEVLAGVRGSGVGRSGSGTGSAGRMDFSSLSSITP